MISPRLTSVFKTQTGVKFRGLLSDAEDRWDGIELRGRRILRVSSKTLLQTGDVVTGDGSEYLLFVHAHRASEVRLLAFEITDRVLWTRTQDVIDPVTRMPRSGVEVEMGTEVPVAIEPTGVTEVEGMERNKFVIRAPGVVLAGDNLGDYTVKTAVGLHGASILGAF